MTIVSVLLVFWLVTALCGAVTLWFTADGEPSDTLPPWRVATAAVLALTVVGTAVITRLTPSLHLCQTTTVTTIGEGSDSSMLQRTEEACSPPLDLQYVALLLLPSVLLVAPVLSEFTIAGLFSAKLRQVVAEEATRQTQSLLVTHELGETFRESLESSEHPDQLEDLPDK